MSYGDESYGAHGNQNNKLFWETSQAIQNTPMNIERLTREIATMASQVESSRVSFNDTLAERDQLKDQAKVAEQRLTEVQRVVARYAVVEDPVVASDGFTYERRVIKQYLEDCKSSKSEAISQQTKEVLNDTLVSNHSLRKLVDLVKDVRPDVVPELSERKPIGHLSAGGGGNGGGQGGNLKMADNNRSNTNDSDGAMLASDLEATWANAVQGKNRGGNRGEARGERGEDRRDERPGGANDRYGGGGRGQQDPAAGASNRSHPCIRVYGFCNFKDECAFAKYPYEACLNNIKGKCRFGNSCKELHVNPMEKKYQNPKAQQSVSQASPTAPAADRAERRAEGKNQANSGSQPTTPASGPADTEKGRKGKKN